MLSVRSHSMFGTYHSWAITMRSLIGEFDKAGCRLFLKSTNGTALLSDDLLKHTLFDIKNADIDICYTVPKNFKRRFSDKSKKKMAIYNYETNIMPKGWGDSHKYIDYILPSSNFSKDILIKNGWPKEKCVVIPHGIDSDNFNNIKKFKLNTNKKFKFLNVSIPHYRKNIPMLIDCYYDGFEYNDDVCLVIKTNIINGRHRSFEINIINEIKNLQKKYKGKRLPQIEIVSSKLDSMIPLYNSCDCLISTSSSEGFGLPMLEALAANLLVVSTCRTGHSDFLNKNNSLIIDSYEDLAPKEYQYWEHSSDAITYFPRKESVIENMINAYKNKDSLLLNFNNERENTAYKYTWSNSVKKIMELS